MIVIGLENATQAVLVVGYAAEPVATDRPRPILWFRDIQLSEGRGG